ncbi:hypothetical protein AM493_02680 [Flavobacterium akiainvivens]|uniref:Uncharacterized protein n=1 Tax=Flavobacterium akiainvivens TaxID=1202724 RepID=A0A0M9VH92_9FLAO|nr:lipocalin family protein [Flavobacterium akiainvivens]KOS05059.1 hypothetical protein AM493_02680 [Flavobacterium akiainvivens]SFQ52077.1 Lipocalin-like domain-containing protein [Flavobacterium akiainvivens]
MKHYFTLLLLITFSINAQVRDSLFGTWEFEAFADDMGVDKEKKARVEGYMKGYTFVFYPDNYYEAKLLTSTEKGIWKLTGNTITATTNEGKISGTLEILSLEPHKMKVRQKELIMTFKRNDSFSNPANIMHKWKFEGTRLDPDDEDLQPAPANNFIDFRPDNTYTVTVGQINETGFWYFDAKTNTIIATSASGAKQWKVVIANSNTLELHMNTAKTGFVFSR